MIRSKNILTAAMLFSVLLLTPGTSLAVRGEQEKPSTTRITGMNTTHYASPSPAIWVPVPQDISGVIDGVLRDYLHLPQEAAKIISSLHYSAHQGIDLYGHPNKPDVWFRHFPAAGGSKGGLAFSMRLGCDGLRNQLSALRRAGVQDLPSSVVQSCDWMTRFPTGRLETGLLLFLVNQDGTLEPVHEVPGRFFPQITPAMMEELKIRGISTPYIAPGGFAGSHHMWVFMEADPDRALPDDTPGYDKQGVVDGGMLVWTGSGFEIQHVER